MNLLFCIFIPQLQEKWRKLTFIAAITKLTIIQQQNLKQKTDPQVTEGHCYRLLIH